MIEIKIINNKFYNRSDLLYYFSYLSKINAIIVLYICDSEDKI